MSINRILNSDRSMKAATGLSVSEFGELTEDFGRGNVGENWNRYEREFNDTVYFTDVR